MDIVNEETEKIVDDLMSKREKDMTSQRKSELRNAISRVVKDIIIMYEKGILIEATPPKVKEPEPTSGEETEEDIRQRNKKEEEYDKKLKSAREITSIISNVSKSIKKLASAGKEILQISQYLKPDEKESETDEAT